MQNSLKFKNIINIINYIILLIIAAIGIIARCKIYFANYSFWQDEILLMLNLFDIKVSEVFLPFEYGQKVPPFFTLILAFLVNFICKPDRQNFMILHFIPFISGILSIFGFYYLLRQIFNNKLTIILGMLLFSVNIPLIYYSNEFKVYSTDVLVCILLLIYYKYFKLRDVSNRRIIIYTLSTFLLVLFSFPVIFIIPSMIFAKFIEEKKINYKALWIIFIGIIIPCLYLWLSDLKTYEYMNDFWVYYGGLNDFSFITLKNIFYNLYKYFNGNMNYDYTLAAALMFILGVCIMLIKKASYNYLILFIILMALTASFAKVYPLAERVCLYIFPVFIIVFLNITEIPIYNLEKNKFLSCLKSLIICVILFFIFQLNQNPYLSINSQKPVEFNNYSSYQSRINAKDIIFSFFDKYKDTQPIFCICNMSFGLNFYNTMYNLNRKLNILSEDAYYEKDVLNKDLDKFLNNENKAGKLWLIGDNYNLSDGSFISDEIIEKKIQKKKYRYDKFNIDDMFYYEIYP